MEIKSRTVADAWPHVLRKVVDHGEVKYVNSHSQWVIEMDEPIVATLTRPLTCMIPQDSGWAKRALDEYAEQFMDPVNKHGFSYTYGERLHEGGQVDKIVEKLQADRDNRQAIITTWNKTDLDILNPPCMIMMDFKIYNNKLNTVAYFRSNDMFMAWPADLYGIIRMSECISSRLDAKVGKATVVSNAPHIYFSSVMDAMQVAGIDRKDREMRYKIMCDEIYGVQELEGAIP